MFPGNWVPAPTAVIVIILVIIFTRGWAPADIITILTYVSPILVPLALLPSRQPRKRGSA